MNHDNLRPEQFSGPSRRMVASCPFRVIILPVPYEHTTSFGHGTCHGPASIIEASAQVELYDEELDGEIYRLTGGIATDDPLAQCGDDEDAVEAIRKKVNDLIW